MELKKEINTRHIVKIISTYLIIAMLFSIATFSYADAGKVVEIVDGYTMTIPSNFKKVKSGSYEDPSGTIMAMFFVESYSPEEVDSKMQKEIDYLRTRDHYQTFTTNGIKIYSAKDYTDSYTYTYFAFQAKNNVVEVVGSCKTINAFDQKIVDAIGKSIRHENKKITSIKLNKKSATIKRGNTFQLKVKAIKPSSADNQKVKWSSSNKKVASVDKNGLVKAKGVGTCTITCSATDGSNVKAICTITVK